MTSYFQFNQCFTKGKVKNYIVHYDLSMIKIKGCVSTLEVKIKNVIDEYIVNVNKMCNIIDDLSVKDEQLLPEFTIGDRKLLEAIKNVDKDEEVEKIIGNNCGLDYLAKGLRCKEIDNMPDEWKELFCWYKNNPEYEDVLKNMIDEAYYTNNDKFIDKAVANLIYKNGDKSVTEIEKYASCAYAHFLKYGLGLRERKTYEIELPDLGTIFHNTLDMFSKELILTSKSWRDITTKEQEDIVEKCVDAVVKDYGDNILFSSKRNEYMISRIKTMSKKTVWALCNHVKEGKFEPVGFEVKFTSKDDINATNILLDDINIGLRGSIDRVDTCVADNDETYVKVIDYKSSSKDFDPSLFYEGVQLQLMVYMSVALDKQKNLQKDREVRPAGVFYYTIDNPFVDKDEKLVNTLRTASGDDEKEKLVVDNAILEKLIMKGIVNNNTEIISKLDKSMVDEEGKLKGKSKVVKLGLNAKGDFKSNSNAISDKDFDLLIKKTCNLIKDKVRDMKDGKIEKKPYKADKSCACNYCEYASICNFDIKIRFRIIIYKVLITRFCFLRFSIPSGNPICSTYIFIEFTAIFTHKHLIHNIERCAVCLCQLNSISTADSEIAILVYT
mgnify:CR=1 FL=1